MSDLERLFHHIVRTLARTDATRLGRPITLGELRGSIIPYRTHRRALGLDCSEDYELLLMRLAAGEGGLARAEPEEARARLAAEAESPNPDLRVIGEVE